VHIVRYYSRAVVGDGGMTGAVKQWSKGFARHGARATIAFDEGSIPESNGVAFQKVRHTGLGDLRVPTELREVLSDADVLVLHSGWTPRNIKAAATARKMGVPYILEPRGAYDPHIVKRRRFVKGAWWLAWEKELVQNALAIHAFFEPEKEHFKAIGYNGPVVIASNGVVEPTHHWDGGSGGYVLWLGRFDPEHKGLDILLEAMRLLPEDERPRLQINGPESGQTKLGGNKKKKVAGMVDELGLGRWVSLGPAVYGDEKKEMLAKAKGFVYPSRWDACPNSTLESVSMGIPTLATPYPLGTYLAERGGAVLADASPEGLAEGLRTLSSDGAGEIGARGADVTATELTWDAVSRQWLDQVEELL
jgi:glycosyltransferase involved in cell wall biosynthesis